MAVGRIIISKHMKSEKHDISLADGTLSLVRWEPLAINAMGWQGVCLSLADYADGADIWLA